MEPKYRLSRLPSVAAWFLAISMAAGCGGGGSAGGPTDAATAPAPAVAGNAPQDVGSGVASEVSPAAADPSPRALPVPVLTFTDTGISVSDRITAIGKWWVSGLRDGLGWEFSLDMGRSWTRGEGETFEVVGDGSKSIWVRFFDRQGNTSEIAMSSCTLDTTAPLSPQVGLETGPLASIRISGLEAMATWEYSLDEQRTWVPGRGDALAVVGNAIRRIWTRQRDAAGNASPAVATMLADTSAGAWVEASGLALSPTSLPAWSGSLLIHGEISRNDADYLRIDVPAGKRLRSLRLVHYASADPIAFYAMQRGVVFDAGTDVQKMITWRHLGPGDLLVELLAAANADQLGSGPIVLWLNQTGSDRTEYAIVLELDVP